MPEIFRTTSLSLTLVVIIGLVLPPSLTAEPWPSTALQWRQVELEFDAAAVGDEPYLSESGWVDFVHDDGAKIRRPMFWDGGKKFRIRFASTKAEGVWRWASKSASKQNGLEGFSGEIQCRPNQEPENLFEEHGFWRIPSGERNLIHADETSTLMCADTPWAIPWRATVEQARVYAADRQAKGFNAALLMTVMPDSNTQGPRSRTKDRGFEVGFEDLSEGSLKRINVEYFQYFDRLVKVLVEHGIAPVYQPVFHGYGWKGGGTAGNKVSAEDYARYCRYLVARYGAQPAIWLVGGDGPARNPTVIEQLDRAGQEIQTWDSYGQPIGIHYSPHALNRTHQDKEWLDFQWCQTGHNGEHVAERVADMWRNEPVKAIANGEPTYENIGETGKGAGWWQGHEAWCNLTAGGTMGVVYGAASLWNWKLSANEPGHADWCIAPECGWREALDFEGSIYPGVAAKILNQYHIRGMQPNWTYTYGRRALLVPNELFVLYMPNGGDTAIVSPEVPRHYKIYDPRNGAVVDEGSLSESPTAKFNSGVRGEPRVVVFAKPDGASRRDDVAPSGASPKR